MLQDKQSLDSSLDISDSRVCCLFFVSQSSTSPPTPPGPRPQRVRKANINVEVGEKQEDTSRLNPGAPAGLGVLGI